MQPVMHLIILCIFLCQLGTHRRVLYAEIPLYLYNTEVMAIAALLFRRLWFTRSGPFSSHLANSFNQTPSTYVHVETKNQLPTYLTALRV